MVPCWTSSERQSLLSLANKGDTAEGASADRIDQVERTDRVCKELAALAVKALLDEAALFPKPGLVDPVSQGAHSDMDFATLVRSAAALQQGFYECARIGYESTAPIQPAAEAVQVQGTVQTAPLSAAAQPSISCSGIPAAGLLPQSAEAVAQAHDFPAAVRKRLRIAGLELEKAMFAETRGVNTHKGAVFIFAYLLGAAGRLFGMDAAACCSEGAAVSSYRAASEAAFSAGQDGIQTERLCAEVRRLAAGLFEEDMAQAGAKQTLTHGERVFLQYGCKGIRGEVEAGLPLVQRNAAYLAGLTHLTQREAYLYTLLRIIAENEDTNVLFRAGAPALRDLQTRCASIVASGVTGAALYAAVESLDDYCIERHISPGGSADLFAAALFCRSLSGLAEER